MESTHLADAGYLSDKNIIALVELYPCRIPLQFMVLFHLQFMVLFHAPHHRQRKGVAIFTLTGLRIH